MRKRAAALACVGLMVGGCAIHGLALRRDDRVSIVLPADRSRVALPTVVHWQPHAPIAAFGVFVDRAPQRPGETLAWLFRGSRDCQGPGCLDPSFLAARNVYRTTTDHVTIDHVAHLSGRSDLHEATIVVLDANGRRVGESAWSVQFLVRATR